MPGNRPVYEILENPLEGEVLAAFLRADEALSRLDERLTLSELASPLASRLLYRNACGVMHDEGCLVHLEDLVLLDGHAFSGAMYADLSAGLGILKLWQGCLRGDAGLLLQAPMPGEADRLDVDGDAAGSEERPELFWDRDWDQPGRLQDWQRVRQATTALPALLAAAIAWDAWHVLQPEQQGCWRSTLVAALVLRARGKTRKFLLPLASGQRRLGKRWMANQPPSQRLVLFLEIVDAAVKITADELAGLKGAQERMRLKVTGAQKNSHLAALAELLIAKPLVSIPMATKALRVSKQAVRLMLSKLGSTPREITGRSRFRCWTVMPR